MKKLKRRLKCLLSYILIITMVLSVIGPGNLAFAAAKKGLNIKKATVLVGDKVVLSLYNETIKDIRSENIRIATVKKDGTVTGKKVGKTNILVTGNKGKVYKCKVTVKAGLSKDTLYLTKGKSYTLKLKGANIKSLATSNKAIATAKKKKTKQIVIKGVKAGNSKITVKAKNNKTYTCDVVVEDPVLSSKEVTLAKGDTLSLTVNNTKQNITWK